MSSKYSNYLFILAAVLFLTAWIGEALVDIGYITKIPPHGFMTFALPVCFNLVMIGVFIYGIFDLKSELIKNKEHPCKIWLYFFVFLLVFLSFNASYILGIYNLFV